jgi:hypothetical protein
MVRELRRSRFTVAVVAVTCALRYIVIRREQLRDPIGKGPKCCRIFNFEFSALGDPTHLASSKVTDRIKHIR